MLSEDLRRAPAPSPALRPERRQLVLRLCPGPYRLPHDVADRLTPALAGFKNRDAAFRLAVFLARFWSSRARLASPFPIDRRALADRQDLDLTEAQIRGAIGTLEAVGFLNRGLPPVGSTYRLTAAGLQRKPILFGFGSEYGPSFAAANARAARARKRQDAKRRAIEAATRPAQVSRTNSPKDTRSVANTRVLMGEVIKSAERQRAALTAELDSGIAAALQRLQEAAGFKGRG